MTDIKLKIGKAKKATPKPVPAFAVREGTTAICRMVTGDIAAGVLFHAILELWVETKKKVSRNVDGETRDYLFLTGQQLQTLSGLSHKQLTANAVPKLRKSSFVEIAKGRITPDSPNMYRIRVDQEAFWQEVAAILDPTKEIKTKEHGHVWVTKMVDRDKLPYLFKRLYDAVSDKG
jgi:hypothetical protein